MKFVFIVYNQGIESEVLKSFKKLNIRGYTKLETVYGQGSKNGEPHFGTHVWPEVNSLILTAVDDDKASKLLDEIKEIDLKFPDEGIHAFVLKLEDMV